MGRAVRLLVALQRDDALPERLGGMSRQVWLEHECRVTGAEARALLGAVDVMARMPALVAEALWARDVVVRDPDGSTPIRRADLDHVTRWPDGATDVSNLQPLGRPWHKVKTSKAWAVHRRRDGTTEGRHRRHGWILRMAPPRRGLARPPDPGPPRLPFDATVP